jgi:hypothetical protein
VADTERLAALRKVRTARDAADAALADPTLTPSARTQAQKAWDDLDTLEGDLILQDLGQKLQEIQSSASDLQLLATQMQGSAASLANLASLIGDVAQAVGGLAEIAALAAQHGLV